MRQAVNCIQTHDVTLRPASDEDMPLLRELNSDPEVLKLADTGGAAEPYTEKTVRDIWGMVSQHALF